jgi:hypothetical protein
MKYLLLAAVLLALTHVRAADATEDDAVIRVNCGSEADYVDEAGVVWSADRELTEGEEATWGARGGGTVTREAALHVGGTSSPEVYRTERYDLQAYEFAVPDGRYTVRLHFAETFDGIYRAGLRVFGVKVNDVGVGEVDPYRDAGGFARPAVFEASGLTVADGKLTITFETGMQSTLINGIEVLQSDPAAPPADPAVAQVLGERGEGLPADWDERPLEGEGVRQALFIGNSHTVFWAIPDTVEALVNAGQEALKLRCSRSVQGGVGLGWHTTNTDLAERIRTGDYAYVVLQGLYEPEDSDGGRTLHAAAQEAGAQTLVYCTWPSDWQSPEEYEEFARLHADLAQELGATLVPVGRAWQAALEQQPELVLLNADGGHSGLLGSYLTACVFYGVLTGQSPEGHPRPATLVDQVPIPGETARFLERVAWQTLQEPAAEAEEPLKAEDDS